MIQSPLAFAQIDNLSVLEALSEGLPQSISESDDEANQSTEDKPDNKNKTKEKRSFIDDQYGFTGRKNFKNPPKSKFSDQGLEYFGYSYFFDQPSTFAPLNNVPVPPDYLIGPDDNIKIILYGNSNAKYTLEVTRDGDIFIPEIGPLFVAGITFKDLKELIKEIVSSELIGTQVSVTLGSLRSIDIFVLGSANKPGMYSISALSTLTNAIIKSGGIDIAGSLRNIKLKRNGKDITTFDFYDLFLKGDTTNDVRLMQGDVIFIEPIGKTAGIRGEVNRPGIYELTEAEQLRELIKFAGNTKPKANLPSAELTRINTSNRSFDLISVDLSHDKNLKIDINAGDLLSVYSVVNNLKKAVLLQGHAQQPGFYAWKDGMRIGDLFTSVNDLLENTELTYVLIERRNLNSQEFEYLQVNLEQLFKETNSKENILLNDQDKIILFPSSISIDSIKTRLIADNYKYDEEIEQYILEDEWVSEANLRKSIEQSIEQEKFPTLSQGTSNQALTSAQTEKKYFEYSYNDYCFFRRGFLQEYLGEDNNDFDAQSIANFCKRQLLEPILSSIKKNGTNQDLGIIKVFGNVYSPGEYPLTRNMVLADAINAASGKKDATYDSEIELISQIKVGKYFDTANRSVNLSDAQDISLKNLDVVTVKQLASMTGTVTIEGEVYFPGVYPIQKNETITSLIKRAGGITDNSDIDAAFFQREALINADIEQLNRAKDDLRRKVFLSNQSGENFGQEKNMFDPEALTALTELISNSEEREGFGRMVVDLNAILSGATQDIALENLDFLRIPKKRDTVSIVGEVYVKTSHKFQDNYSIDDYLSLSGGITTYGDQDAIYIIKSNGSIISSSKLSSGFFRSGESQIEPGDTIIVPLLIQPFSAIRASTEISQIVYQMAIAAAAVNSF